jgi:NAD-dependent dihydropyrimidine dehydrogenase PreA subunit
MIELVSESRCIQCNKCVEACPTDVFDAVPDGIPVIARQEDCQTCFMCEVYCPVDALFVAPNVDRAVGVDEAQLSAAGELGSYRAAIGWTKAAPGGPDDLPQRLHEFRLLNTRRLATGR